jgi:hypothetical protein
VTTLKLAVTVFAEPMLTWQEPEPEHAPDQPVKVDPDDGVAVNVTTEPEAKLAEQIAPQFTPAGVLVTTPEPVPAKVTDRG